MVESSETVTSSDKVVNIVIVVSGGVVSGGGGGRVGISVTGASVVTVVGSVLVGVLAGGHCVVGNGVISLAGGGAIH